MLDNIITDNQRAKQEMNTMYLNQTGAKSKVSVINFFSKGTIPFQFFSVMFSAFGFYIDLMDAFGFVIAAIIGIFLGGFIEGAKHFFVKGAFADFKWAWRVLLAGFAFITFTIALAYHYKSLNTFKNVSVREDLKAQVLRESETLNKQLDLISTTQKNNKDLASVFSNGKSGDDIYATRSIESNNALALQLSALSKDKSSAEAFLKQSQKTANQNSNTLLLLFITMEFFSLLGVISKGLIGSETSDAVQSVVKTSEKLATLEENVVRIVETKMINDTMQRVEASVAQNTPAQIGAVSQGQQKAPSPTPQIGYETSTKGQVWSNAKTDYPTLPTNCSEIYGTNDKANFFKGSHDDFVNAYEGDGFKVEKHPIVPKSNFKKAERKITNNNKLIEEFKILDDISRDRDVKSDSDSEKVSLKGVPSDFISEQDWNDLSEEKRALALSYIDLSLFDQVTETTMIQVVYYNGLVKNYDEPLMVKREAIKEYQKLRGGTLAIAGDVYMDVMEKLETLDKIKRRSRYLNRCRGLSTGKVVVA